uniref:TSA: Wollemia nobilis Ref_Wollemi_Transcript_3783_1526 transcribed RNA sequence n=1 Tax=Wollemia nobilis TaxID=56998 RepID=A0A0C9SAF0_9CONI
MASALSFVGPCCASMSSSCNSLSNSSLRRLLVPSKDGRQRIVRLAQQHVANEFGNGFRGHSRNSSTKLRQHLPRSTLMANAGPPKQEVLTVGDFMTKRENLFVVKPTTLIDDALESLVEHRVTGLPVIDDDWKLVGVVSDYDMLALDSISGAGRTETGFFPEVDSTWKAFNELRKLLNKTNGKIVAEVMTPSPLVVRETTNLEDAARLLLETKYRRLPVVDNDGKLVGMLTRGNVIRAALQMKHAAQQGLSKS